MDLNVFVARLTAATQSQFTCDIIYNVAADGSFSENLTCTGTQIAGPSVGDTFRITGIQIDGDVLDAGAVVMLTDTAAAGERFESWTSGSGSKPFVDPADFETKRICGRSGIAIKTPVGGPTLLQ